VAYLDYDHSSKATVKRYNGTDWERVGNAGFSEGGVYNTSLAFAPDGTPYLAYQDLGNNHKATVMRFDGAHWENVGSAGFSADQAYETSLAFAPDGTPYVAYRDVARSEKATVMRLIGLPGAPTAVSAVAGDGLATVTFTAPAANGSPITGYTVTSIPSGGTGTCAAPPATTCTVTGLSNGTPYQFRVVATNGVGPGDPSVPSAAVTPALQVLRIVSAAPSANLLTVTLNADGAATTHLTLLPGSGASCGTAAQIQAGLDSMGGNAYRQGSLALAAATNGAYTLRNLGHAASYTLCATNGAAIASVAVTTPWMTTYPTAGWTEVGGAGFSAGEAPEPSLAFAPDGTPYVAFQDEGNSSKATVMRYNGTAWENVGSPGFSTGGATYASLAFAPDGMPYVAFQDGGNSTKATVMRYTGTVWENVGSAGFSEGMVHFISLAFAPNGMPYLAYQDVGNSVKATVMRYNGTAWENVGSPGFSTGWASYTSLAFAPDGTPYLAYQDAGNSDKATVKRYNGTAWVDVGSVGFSAGEATDTFLAFSPNGTPYVVYRGDGQSYKPTVQRYNGTAWVDVGIPGFTEGTVNDTSLAFAPDGTPYVVYQDVSNGHKVTVKRYNGTDWVNVGGAGFSAGLASEIWLTFASDGTPYVAYRDFGHSGKATVMRLVSAPQTLPLPGGASTVSVAVTGGPPGCTVQPGMAISDTLPPNLPQGATAPQGALAFTAAGCTGGTLTVRATYPSGTLNGLTAYKYGPPQAGATSRWFAHGSISGDTVTYTVTDDGLGDSETSTPGVIRDPFAPLLLAVPGAGAGGAVGIPTLGEWGLALLSLLAAALGALVLRRQGVLQIR
jgi:hypothetical protein